MTFKDFWDVYDYTGSCDRVIIRADFPTLIRTNVKGKALRLYRIIEQIFEGELEDPEKIDKLLDKFELDSNIVEEALSDYGDYFNPLGEYEYDVWAFLNEPDDPITSAFIKAGFSFINILNKKRVSAIECNEGMYGCEVVIELEA